MKDRWIRAKVVTVKHHLLRQHFSSTGCQPMSRAKDDIGKLTLRIADPTMMKIKKDVKVNFADQLGVVGKSLRGSFKGWLH